MKLQITNEVEIFRTARLIQAEGLFDIPRVEVSRETWEVRMPIESKPWQVGLIVGPSGSGKSTLARKAFPGKLFSTPDFPRNRAAFDLFPQSIPVKEVAAILSSVGFSSPPAWMRPFHCLSNGEQFRVSLAYALACAVESKEESSTIVFDEFTSVVDRTVAKVGSAAVAKAIRARPGIQFVAVTCHDDVEDWLQPDWVVRMPTGEFTRRLLQRRPPVELEITRCNASAWNLFRRHHYLSHELNRTAKCWMGLVDGRPAAFASAIHCPHPKGGWWREHRTVCLPDFQGVGIGNAMSEAVASAMMCLKGKYRSTTSHPAMIAHRQRSKNWTMLRSQKIQVASQKMAQLMKRSATISRPTAGFEFVGKPRPDLARAWGIDVRYYADLEMATDCGAGTSPE